MSIANLRRLYEATNNYIIREAVEQELYSRDSTVPISHIGGLDIDRLSSREIKVILACIANKISIPNYIIKIINKSKSVLKKDVVVNKETKEALKAGAPIVKKLNGYPGPLGTGKKSRK